MFVRREDRIKAHFPTCFISLLVYRLLEKKLGEEFTCSQILETLRNMNVTLLSKDKKNSTYRKTAHNAANKKTATPPMFIGLVAAFFFHFS